MKPRAPPGLTACRSRGDDLAAPDSSLGFADCQTLVLALTFLAYALFHAGRKPPGIVKSVLAGSDSFGLPAHPNVSLSGAWSWSTGSQTAAPPWAPQVQGTFSPEADAADAAADMASDVLPGWPPFQGAMGLGLLGEVDMLFLCAYSVAMFAFGHMGDRMDLRLLLALGMLLTGALTALCGAAYFYNIHSLPFFLVTSTLAGLVNASGWPCVVAIMANWYGQQGRGLLFGMWNCHTSLGNIMGALLASAALRHGWGWAYVVPGVAISLGSVLVYLFLPASPASLGFTMDPNLQTEVHQNTPKAGTTGRGGEWELQPLNQSGGAAAKGAGVADAEGPESAGVSRDVSTYDEDEAGLLEEMELGGLVRKGRKKYSNPDEARAIGFLEAWAIPGVAPYAACLFFAKLVAYTFLYWLPFYISRTEIEGHHLTVAEAGVTSTVFDVGGVLGGIVAGHLSDVLQARAVVTVVFLALVAPALAAYVFLGGASLWANVCLLAVVGFLVNGPYALITCAVSADLGQHRSLEGNARALATVTAIIDGTGSVGAAVGPFLTGVISEAGGPLGWALVFVMLCVSTVAALCCILHLAIPEMHALLDTCGWQPLSRPTSDAAIMQQQRLALSAQFS